jgi:hypothetical protein
MTLSSSSTPRLSSKPLLRVYLWWFLHPSFISPFSPAGCISVLMAPTHTALTRAAAVRGLVPNEIDQAEPKDSAAVLVEGVFAGFDEPNEVPEEGALPKENPGEGALPKENPGEGALPKENPGEGALPKENPEDVARGALAERAAGAETGSPEESLLSQATHRWAALSLKTRQTGHLRELGRLTR